MIKHFCDLCGKQIDSNNTALTDYKSIESFNGLHGLQYNMSTDKEICYSCAKTLKTVTEAIIKHNTIIIK